MGGNAEENIAFRPMCFGTGAEGFCVSYEDNYETPENTNEVVKILLHFHNVYNVNQSFAIVWKTIRKKKELRKNDRFKIFKRKSGNRKTEH